jgi:hypothetical protein
MENTDEVNPFLSNKKQSAQSSLSPN